MNKLRINQRTLDVLLKTIENYLTNNQLNASEAELCVEYPDMWQVDGVDLVLKPINNKKQFAEEN